MQRSILLSERLSKAEPRVLEVPIWISGQCTLTCIVAFALCKCRPWSTAL